MKVMLNYTYIFDPNEAWTSFSQFDDAMAKMLSDIGLEANFIKVIGDEGAKVIEISKKAEIKPVEDNTNTIKQQKYNLMQKKGYDGKFVKVK